MNNYFKYEPSYIRGHFKKDDNAMVEITIENELVGLIGEYDNETKSNTGNLTYLVNGLSKSLPFELKENDTFQVIRDDTDNDGWYMIKKIDY